MQPVLSRALRMLLGRAAFDEDDLAREAERLRNDPTVMDAFPDADPVDTAHEPPLVSAADTETLIQALDGTGVDLRAETNALHLIANGLLRIASHPAAMLDHPDAACVDGLDQRQWALLAHLQRPGERLPLICTAAEEGAFRVFMCAWVDGHDASEIHSLRDLRARVDAWDGAAPPAVAWQRASDVLRERARAVVAQAAERARRERNALIARQHEAARLPLSRSWVVFLCASSRTRRISMPSSTDWHPTGRLPPAGCEKSCSASKAIRNDQSTMSPSCVPSAKASRRTKSKPG
jgi:hypothetical protein